MLFEYGFCTMRAVLCLCDLTSFNIAALVQTFVKHFVSVILVFVQMMSLFPCTEMANAQEFLPVFGFNVIFGELFN